MELWWFSRGSLRAARSSQHTEMDIHLSLGPWRATYYNSFDTRGMPPTLLTYYSTVTCIRHPAVEWDAYRHWWWLQTKQTNQRSDKHLWLVTNAVQYRTGGVEGYLPTPAHFNVPCGCLFTLFFFYSRYRNEKFVLFLTKPKRTVSKAGPWPCNALQLESRRFRGVAKNGFIFYCMCRNCV